LNRLGVAICKACGKKYSKWITPVSAKGICGDCFQAELATKRKILGRKIRSLLKLPCRRKPKADGFASGHFYRVPDGRLYLRWLWLAIPSRSVR
jgi:hypothetical protein